MFLNLQHLNCFEAFKSEFTWNLLKFPVISIMRHKLNQKYSNQILFISTHKPQKSPINATKHKQKKKKRKFLLPTHS